MSMTPNIWASTEHRKAPCPCVQGEEDDDDEYGARSVRSRASSRGGFGRGGEQCAVHSATCSCTGLDRKGVT